MSNFSGNLDRTIVLSCRWDMLTRVLPVIFLLASLTFILWVSWTAFDTPFSKCLFMEGGLALEFWKWFALCWKRWAVSWISCAYCLLRKRTSRLDLSLCPLAPPRPGADKNIAGNIRSQYSQVVMLSCFLLSYAVFIVLQMCASACVIWGARGSGIFLREWRSNFKAAFASSGIMNTHFGSSAA